MRFVVFERGGKKGRNAGAQRNCVKIAGGGEGGGGAAKVLLYSSNRDIKYIHRRGQAGGSEPTNSATGSNSAG
jgi:hypothetical protein